MTRAISAALLAAVSGIFLATGGFAQDVVTKQYDDGGVYEGTFKDGKQHGRGTYRLPNGYVYEGDWVDGEILGQGKATYPNGSVYEGQFKGGKPDGKGKITYADGGSYEGDWVQGEINGEGVASYANGTTYTGTLVWNCNALGSGRAGAVGTLEARYAPSECR